MARQTAKKKAPTKNKKALVKKDGNAQLAVLDNSHLGFENADQESYSIPFLAILQTNSPQCIEDNGAYIEGAKAGMFLNTASQEIYDGKKGIQVIPCYYVRALVEWVPREDGGGFRGQHSPESINIMDLERDDAGKFLLPNGNHLMDTRYHYVLLLTKEGPRPVVLSLASTQIKASKNWMTAMRDRRAKHPVTKKLVPVPMMANVWLISTVTQSNDKGSWKGVKVEFDHMIEVPKEQDLFLMAKEFHNQISTGVAKVEEPIAPPTSTDNLF